jgi:hypothetical protein
VAAAPLFLQILLFLALEVTLALILSLSSLQGTLHLDRTLAALPDRTAVPSKVHIAACFGATERVVAVLALVISCVGFFSDNLTVVDRIGGLLPRFLVCRGGAGSHFNSSLVQLYVIILLLYNRAKLQQETALVRGQYVTSIKNIFA